LTTAPSGQRSCYATGCCRLNTGAQQCSGNFFIYGNAYRRALPPLTSWVRSIHGLDLIVLGWVKNFPLLMNRVGMVPIAKSVLTYTKGGNFGHRPERPKVLLCHCTACQQHATIISGGLVGVGGGLRPLPWATDRRHHGIRRHVS